MVARKSLSIEESGCMNGFKKVNEACCMKHCEKHYRRIRLLMNSARKLHTVISTVNQWQSFFTQVQNLVFVTVCNLQHLWAFLNASNKLGEKCKGHSSSSLGNWLFKSRVPALSFFLRSLHSLHLSFFLSARNYNQMQLSGTQSMFLH